MEAFFVNLKIRKTLLYSIAVGMFFLIGLVAFWFSRPEHQEYVETQMRPGWRLSENIAHSPNNRQFAQYLVDQELLPLLDEEGPYTVFVPTDTAFANLPPTSKQNLAKNDGAARSVLLFHIVAGKYLFADLKDGMILTTVQGEQLHVKKEGNNVSLNGYSYIQTYDIASKNGVIHMVTNYIIPESLLQQ